MEELVGCVCISCSLAFVVLFCGFGHSSRVKHTRKTQNLTNFSENDRPLQGDLTYPHDAEVELWYCAVACKFIANRFRPWANRSSQEVSAGCD